MKTILYTKYNSTRKPEYQLSTSIIEEDGLKYVVKKAIQPKAKEHLLSLPKKRTVLKNIYKDMDIVSCEVKDDMVVFPFVKGKSLLRDIDFQTDDVDDIVEKIKVLLEKIMQYKEECYCPFEMTEEFERCFGYYFSDQEVQALCPVNIDSILGNFFELEDGRLCSIDYEWVAEFPVPISFIEYRALFYLYAENEKYLSAKISQDAFLEKFGFSKRDNILFCTMELNFQQEICGDGMKYAYLDNYRKKTISFEEIEVTEDSQSKYDKLENEFKNALRLLKEAEDREANKSTEIRKLKRHETEIYAMLEQQNAYINDLKHMMKNPLYGLKKLTAKAGNENGKNRQMLQLTDEEIEAKAYEYKRKYIYNRWMNHCEAAETYDETFEVQPLVSVLMYVENLSAKDLKSSIESLCKQVYDKWQLYVVVKGKDRNDAEELVASCNRNIRIVSENIPLEEVEGTYITYLESGDLLRSNALYEVVSVINENPNVDFIYSDEDVLSASGSYRSDPFFKPGWSPDTLMSFWYTGHMAVYRKSIAVEIGGLCEDLTVGKEYDFALRFTEKTQNVAHIEKVLYHSKTKVQMPIEISVKVQERAIQRRGIAARVEPVSDMEQSRVIYDVVNNPKVSIIIPSKDNYPILKVCIESLVKNSTYKNYEIILVDNGSNKENKERYQELCDAHGVQYIYQEMRFNFSKMCNIGAKVSEGEYLVFLNDDIEILQADWIERMVGHASLSHVGAVGAKLLYPNSDFIQHIGVVMYKDGPAHAISKYSDAEVYSRGRNKIEYNWLAVTAACLVIKAEKFHQVNGFNENIKVAFNDVDFCLKLIEAGYFNVNRNDVTLYHHESISRGDDNVSHTKRIRSLGELEQLKFLHPQFVGKDPFYNRNLAQENVGFDIAGAGLTIEDDREKKVSQIADIPLENAEIMCSVDLLEVESERVLISGWSMIPGSFENNDKAWKLLIKGEQVSYLVDTDKDYRPDVADAYPNELLIDYVGFKCVFEKNDLEAGDYQLGVIGEGGSKMMDRKLEIVR